MGRRVSRGTFGGVKGLSSGLRLAIGGGVP